MTKYIGTVTIFILIAFLACGGSDDMDPMEDANRRQEMRDFVIGISAYAKSINAGFNIIPQNGIDIVVDQKKNPAVEYLDAVDGHGQEDLFYGYDNDDQVTAASATSEIQSKLAIAMTYNNVILVTDYCSTLSNMDDSYSTNAAADYISFAADHRELDNIPIYPSTIQNENSDDINTLVDAQNFLYLINPEQYTTKADFINAVTATNYDVLIMDFFFHDDSLYTMMEIEQLKNKMNGGKRLVISYMSIGEAEEYRYYWNTDWNTNLPSWINQVNPNWPGNFKVKYWESEWQDIIYGNDDSYLKKILDAGFDGVYLDIIDAYEFYE